MSQAGDHKSMRTITLEEHYATLAFIEGSGHQIKYQLQAACDHPQVATRMTRLLEQLCNLDNRRIAEMDVDGIDVQVLSLTSPGVEQLDAHNAVTATTGYNHTYIVWLLNHAKEVQQTLHRPHHYEVNCSP